MAKPIVAIFQLVVLALMTGAFFSNWTVIHDQLPVPVNIDLALTSITIHFPDLTAGLGGSKLSNVMSIATTVAGAASGDHTGLMKGFDGIKTFADFRKKACDNMDVGEGLAQVSGLKGTNSCAEAMGVIIIGYCCLGLLGISALSAMCAIVQATAGGLVNPRKSHIFAMITFFCITTIFLAQGISGIILLSMFDVKWMFFPGMGMFFGFFSCLLTLLATCMSCVAPEDDQKKLMEQADAEYGAAGQYDPNQQYADPNQQWVDPNQQQYQQQGY